MEYYGEVTNKTLLIYSIEGLNVGISETLHKSNFYLIEITNTPYKLQRSSSFKYSY